MSSIFEEDVVCPHCGNEISEFYEIEGWNEELQDDGDEQVLICEKCRKKYKVTVLRPFCFDTEKVKEKNDDENNTEV